MCIANDSVDHDMVSKPCRWDMNFIRNFMIVFGLISSIFDYITFGVLLKLFHSNTSEFRTGWFVESVLSATLIILIIRTRKFCFNSRPSPYMASMAVVVCAFTLYLPFSAIAPYLGFVPLKGAYYGALIAILVGYITTVEIAKKFFLVL